MKRMLICLIIAFIATPAAAEMIGTTTSGNITVSYTWDDSAAEYDVVDIYLSALGGVANGSEVVLFEGAWRSVGGSFIVYPAEVTVLNYKKHASDMFALDDESWVNFSYNASADWSRDGGATAYTTLFQGGWYNGSASEANWSVGAGDTDGDGITENLLAHLVVTKGTTEITFGGGPNDKIGYTYDSGTTEVTSFMVPIPEPSTLALLACGLFGLLAYTWRKQR